MGGKAKLPPGIEKATRMKWKHAAAAAGKPAKRAAVAAPSKSRGKRKPTLAPRPPVRTDEAGNLVREIAAE